MKSSEPAPNPVLLMRENRLCTQLSDARKHGTISVIIVTALVTMGGCAAPEKATVSIDQDFESDGSRFLVALLSDLPTSTHIQSDNGVFDFKEGGIQLHELEGRVTISGTTSAGEFADIPIASIRRIFFRNVVALVHDGLDTIGCSSDQSVSLVFDGGMPIRFEIRQLENDALVTILPARDMRAMQILSSAKEVLVMKIILGTVAFLMLYVFVVKPNLAG